jgi:hypothetical protein
MIFVFAHAGHWAVQLLYVAPVLFIAGVIAREKIRERRERRNELEEPHPDHSGRD